MQPNLFMESGIHCLLHSSCNQQIFFAKFNLSILYPPSYERTVLYYDKANTELIRRTIDQFDWLRTLSSVNVDEKVYFFTKALLNIIQNFIPHETIICDERDPPWINKEIKKLMLVSIANINCIYLSKNRKKRSRLADLATSPKTY